MTDETVIVVLSDGQTWGDALNARLARYSSADIERMESGECDPDDLEPVDSVNLHYVLYAVRKTLSRLVELGESGLVTDRLRAIEAILR